MASRTVFDSEWSTFHLYAYEGYGAPGGGGGGTSVPRSLPPR
jgi:hypothetical protein